MKQDTVIALLEQKMETFEKGISEIKSSIKDLGSEIKSSYVTKTEHDLIEQSKEERITRIEKLVYGAVGLALITLSKAVLDLVTIVQAK